MSVGAVKRSDILESQVQILRVGFNIEKYEFRV